MSQGSLNCCHDYNARLKPCLKKFNRMLTKDINDNFPWMQKNDQLKKWPFSFQFYKLFKKCSNYFGMFADIHHIHVMSKLDWSWGSWEGAKGSGDEGANVFGGIGRAPCEPAWDNIWYLINFVLLRRQSQPCHNGFAGVLHHTAMTVKMMLSSLPLTKVSLFFRGRKHEDLSVIFRLQDMSGLTPILEMPMTILISSISSRTFRLLLHDRNLFLTWNVKIAAAHPFVQFCCNRDRGAYIRSGHPLWVCSKMLCICAKQDPSLMMQQVGLPNYVVNVRAPHGSANGTRENGTWTCQIGTDQFVLMISRTRNASHRQ